MLYDVGDVVRLDATFTDIDDEPVDPTTVTFRIREPDGALTAYVYGTDPEVVRSAAGVYHVEWSVTLPGLHRWRFESTGTGQAAEESRFDARASKVH